VKLRVRGREFRLIGEISPAQDDAGREARPDEGFGHGWPERLNGQALATLPAASRKNGAAGSGAHADEEAVRTLATAVVRLKCTFHL
jgi:hypothetical protein